MGQLKISKLFSRPLRYPVLYEESLNTVLSQEAIRFNRLLKIIAQTLNDLLKAVKGLVVMSDMLEKMSTSIFNNAVPAVWAAKAYPSLKPLAAWVIDLNARTDFLNKWVEEGIPAVFWISGFYFPQAFLTGTLQNYARKYVISIDTIGFSFQVLDKNPTSPPKDGCCIWGLYLEGSRWNPVKKVLDESRPKELYTCKCSRRMRYDHFDEKNLWNLFQQCHQFGFCRRSSTESRTESTIVQSTRL